MKLFFLSLLFCYANVIHSQTWREYSQSSEQSSIKGDYEEAEYYALLALQTAKKENGMNHESYEACLQNLSSIFSQIFENDAPFFGEIESLNSKNVLMYKTNFTKTDKKLFDLLVEKGDEFNKRFNEQVASQLYLRAYQLISDAVFDNEQYYLVYENLLRQISNYNDENGSDLIVRIYENQLNNLNEKFSEFPINYISQFDIVLRAYMQKNEVNKSLEVVSLMEKLYIKTKSKRQDNFLSLYVNVGDEFQNVDMKSSLTFYEIAYEKFKSLEGYKDNMNLSDLFEGLSEVNYNLKNYEAAINYDLESLKHLENGFSLEMVKFRLIKTYYKIGEKDKAYQLIDEINQVKEKLNKQSEQYLIYKVNLTDILLQNNDHEKAIPVLKEMAAIFSKQTKVNINDLNSYNFYLSKCYYHTNQILLAKDIFYKIDKTTLYSSLQKEYDDLKQILDKK
jgi:tetratricopeptide (TPR) repeat protein